MITRQVFEWAERTPDKTALIFNGQALSYRAFADRIALARGYFMRRGISESGSAVIVAATP